MMYFFCSYGKLFFIPLILFNYPKLDANLKRTKAECNRAGYLRRPAGSIGTALTPKQKHLRTALEQIPPKRQAATK
jgi:hypothetical protein